MTDKYKDILDKLRTIDEHGLGNEQIKKLINVLQDRSDEEIDKFLEDKGDLKVILRSYY